MNGSRFYLPACSWWFYRSTPRSLGGDGNGIEIQINRTGGRPEVHPSQSHPRLDLGLPPVNSGWCQAFLPAPGFKSCRWRAAANAILIALVTLQPPSSSSQSPHRRTLHWKRWLLVLVAIVPFQLPLLQHLLTGPIATGFLQYDGPYYMANARAIFEHGNGWAYPNPYDPDPNAPVIYFHWLIWLLGAGVKFLHLDPGVLFATMGITASLVCSALTLRLVELILPGPSGRSWWFLLTMWGGGVICLGTALLNVASGRTLLDHLFRLDGMDGWWCPNWGRNLLLPTEAVYHSLVAAAWIGILQRKWGLALGATAALAATHPFSGLQHMLVLGAWLGVLALRERTPAAWGRVGFVAAILLLFGLYYFWFLNRFPSHRKLVVVWTSAFDVTLLNILLAVGPLVVIALCRLRREQWRLRAHEWFLVTASVVTFLLMKHDWFFPPHQPAHFNRGYLWLPIWLLALPQLQLWGARLAASRGHITAGVCFGAAGVLISADNACFIAKDLGDGELKRIYLSREQREMFSWMNEAGLRGVLLCADLRLSYYSATYTGARPYIGHFSNTPDIRGRWQNITVWHRQGETGLWFQSVDYILVERSNAPKVIDWGIWNEVHRNADYALLSRRSNR